MISKSTYPVVIYLVTLCLLITIPDLPCFANEVTFPTLPIFEFTLSTIFLLVVVIIEWLIIKPYVKHCAYRYAEHAWSMLDHYDDL